MSAPLVEMLQISTGKRASRKFSLLDRAGGPGRAVTDEKPTCRYSGDVRRIASR